MLTPIPAPYRTRTRRRQQYLARRGPERRTPMIQPHAQHPRARRDGATARCPLPTDGNATALADGADDNIWLL